MSGNEDLTVKPVKWLSSKQFFMKSYTISFKTKYPNEQLDKQFVKQRSEKWQALTVSEKRRFEVMANCDRKRYRAEMKMIKYQKKKRNLGLKIGKDETVWGSNTQNNADGPNLGRTLPRKHSPAFIHFQNHCLETKRERSEKKGWHEEICRQWRMLDMEAKDYFKKLANDDLVRFRTELAEFERDVLIENLLSDEPPHGQN